MVNCGVVAAWCGVLSVFDAGVRDTWQSSSSSMHPSIGQELHRGRASRGASRLDTDGAPPPQLDLTAPHQFGAR